MNNGSINDSWSGSCQSLQRYLDGTFNASPLRAVRWPPPGTLCMHFTHDVYCKCTYGFQSSRQLVPFGDSQSLEPVARTVREACDDCLKIVRNWNMSSLKATDDANCDWNCARNLDSVNLETGNRQLGQPFFAEQGWVQISASSCADILSTWSALGPRLRRHAGTSIHKICSAMIVIEWNSIKCQSFKLRWCMTIIQNIGCRT